MNFLSSLIMRHTLKLAFSFVLVAGIGLAASALLGGRGIFPIDFLPISSASTGWIAPAAPLALLTVILLPNLLP